LWTALKVKTADPMLQLVPTRLSRMKVLLGQDGTPSPRAHVDATKTRYQKKQSSHAIFHNHTSDPRKVDRSGLVFVGKRPRSDTQGRR
jgi:hypothetical protein